MMQPSPNINYRQLDHLYFQSDLPTGKRLLILGESEQGDYYFPYRISSLNQVKHVFKSGNLVECYNILLEKFQEADIMMMRMEAGQFYTAYQALVRYPFDLIYIDNLYFDQLPDAIPGEIISFLDFCREKEYQGQLIHGFFDVKDCQIYEDYELHLFPLIESLTSVVEEGIEESGKYLSVVARQCKGERSGLIYAGLVASLEPKISPINKTLPVELEQEFSNEQFQSMGRAGFVTFKNTLKKGVVCATAPCAVVTEDSVHRHIANFRIAQSVIADVTSIQEEYIGQAGIDLHVPELQLKLEAYLSQLIQDEVLRDYHLALSYDALKGMVYCQIDLVPIFSVYAITQSTQLRVRV